MSNQAGGCGREQVGGQEQPEPELRRAMPGHAGGVQRGRHKHLRRSTADAHRLLETTLGDAGCFSSMVGYRRYLGAVAPLYAALEATLEAAGALRLVPDWPRRRKLGLILADLRAAECADGTTDHLSPAVAARLGPPSAWCAGDVLGALYVLEGATLGGAVLARQMRLSGLAGWDLRGFLDPYGAERGAMWRAFLGQLEAAELTSGDEVALCSRACATFALFAVAIGGLMHDGVLR